jgi:DNA-directed RNA polymerase specialized sigma24 family protein
MRRIWRRRPSPPSGVLLDVRAAFGAIHELSPKLRDAIAAVDLFGLSYGEAARALRIRRGTVQSRLASAREQVSAALLVGQHA